MRKESSEKLSGNAQFEGYGIDLIHEIASILGFNYTFKLVPDGRYGSYNHETKEWDGMMKELLDQVCRYWIVFEDFFLEQQFAVIIFLQKADIAIADLTITYDREQAVDFTMPFMNLGKQIHYL